MSISKIFHKIQTTIKSPRLLLILPLQFLSPLFNDRFYLKLLFRLKVGYKLDLSNPKTYNEKLQWLKLYHKDPILPKLIDKYEYKKYVKNIIGEEYVIETFGVWSSFNEIDFDKLPNQFVLKTTHDQGGVIICKDKFNLDISKVEKKINKHLKRNLFYLMREWPYKYVKPRIIVEELLVDETKGDLWDYKFYCFDGKPEFMFISMGRQSGHVPLYYYDMEFNYLEIERPGHKAGERFIEKPINWELMKELASKLSKGQPHVRIDFFNINGKILAGEFTLYQGGGMMPFIPKEWDDKFGKLIHLPKK